jgi:hypothetical protein
MSELDTSGSVEGLGRATSPVYSTTPILSFDKSSKSNVSGEPCEFFERRTPTEG